MSYGDIQTRVKLFLGAKQASIVQDFQTLSEVVRISFGSDAKTKKERERANIPVPKSSAELAALFNKVF